MDKTKVKIYSTNCECPNCQSKRTVLDNGWADGTYYCLNCGEDDLCFDIEGNCYSWNEE